MDPHDYGRVSTQPTRFAWNEQLHHLHSELQFLLFSAVDNLLMKWRLPEASGAELRGAPFESIARRSLDGAYGVELEAPKCGAAAKPAVNGVTCCCNVPMPDGVDLYKVPCILLTELLNCDGFVW